MKSPVLFAPNSFCNKNVIITGGGGDIALAIALKFAEAGINKIALLDNNEDTLEKSAKILSDQGAHVIKVVLDLSNKQELDKAMTTLCQKKKTLGIFWSQLPAYLSARLYLIVS